MSQRHEHGNETKENRAVMRRSESAGKEFAEMKKWFMEKAGLGSKTAEGIALHRFGELQRPESERICTDPYSVYF